MAQGLSSEDHLQSIDGADVKIKNDDLLTADSSAQELLWAILKELRELKLMILTIGN